MARRDRSSDEASWTPAGVLRDLGAALTVAIANVPDSMANAVLTGVNPVRGLYALMAGTPTAALTTSSRYLTVAVTAAMAIAVGDALAPVPSEGRLPAFVTLTMLIGAITIILGLARAATAMRFVPNAVLRGFLTGVAVNIIIAQIPNVTGAASDAPSKVARTFEIVTTPSGFSPGALLLAALTAALALGIEHTPARRFAMALSLLVVASFANFTGADVVRVGDIGAISSSLPKIVLPQLRYVLPMAIPAVSAALIGLIQTAAIGKNTPNPGGHYPDTSRDFVGQGVANLVSGVFGGVPVGGSVSATALNVQSGARTRLANVLVGPIILALVLLLSKQVESIPMSVLAAILIVVAVRAIDVPALRAVWDTSPISAAVMGVTFVGTLIMPIQFAVFLGIGLTVVRQVYQQGTKPRVVGLELTADGRLAEIEPPTKLVPNTVEAIETRGDLAFAGAQALQDVLPDPQDARGAILVLRVHGQEGEGSTFIEVLRRYHRRLDESGATLMLSGVGGELRGQLDRTGLTEVIGRDNIFYATNIITDSTVHALLAAKRRLS